VHVHGPATGPRLWISAGLTGAFVLFELAVGVFANSLALISDAGHNFADAGALLLAAWAFSMAGRPADRDRSFGFHRAGVLAALVNALTLVLLALFILYEAYHRLVNPEPVASLPMIAVAAVALLLNTAVAWWLHAAGQHDVNVRSAFIHMVGDAVASVGVIVAGLAVWATGSPIWDPIVSVVIALFIVWSSWGILKETIDILMESTPGRVRVDDLIRDVEAVPGVLDIHDLHVWALGSNVHALSAHLQVENADRATNSELVGVVRQVKQVLAERHGIAHATLETHCSDGDTDCLPCEIHPHPPDSHAHEHTHTHAHDHDHHDQAAAGHHH
jgi:cobalt-zinc-cadmium efflux system protein